MEILAIIPARSGSKRIPGKNTKILAGLPLIEHTILSAVHCQLITDIVITSDIESLVEYEEMHPGIEFIRRPDVLCGPNIGDYDVINHALSCHGAAYDMIVYLRPTTPFRADYHICEAIKQMKAADINATGLRSVELMPESAFKCFTIPAFLSPITEGQSGIDATDMPNHMVKKTYKPNGYIDICKPEIVARGKLWGDWVLPYITPHTIEIDTPDDWAYAEWYANRDIDAPLRFGKREI